LFSLFNDDGANDLTGGGAYKDDVWLLDFTLLEDPMRLRLRLFSGNSPILNIRPSILVVGAVFCSQENHL
jgi:hypothetical protein